MGLFVNVLYSAEHPIIKLFFLSDSFLHFFLLWFQSSFQYANLPIKHKQQQLLLCLEGNVWSLLTLYMCYCFKYAFKWLAYISYNNYSLLKRQRSIRWFLSMSLCRISLAWHACGDRKIHYKLNSSSFVDICHFYICHFHILHTFWLLQQFQTVRQHAHPDIVPWPC